MNEYGMFLNVFAHANYNSSLLEKQTTISANYITKKDGYNMPSVAHK